MQSFRISVHQFQTIPFKSHLFQSNLIGLIRPFSGLIRSNQLSETRSSVQNCADCTFFLFHRLSGRPQIQQVGENRTCGVFARPPHPMGKKRGPGGGSPREKRGSGGRLPPGIRLVLLLPRCGLLSRSSSGIPLIPCRCEECTQSVAHRGGSLSQPTTIIPPNHHQRIVFDGSERFRGVRKI